MGWTAGIRSKKEVWVVGVLLLRDGKGSSIREVSCYNIASFGEIREDHEFAILAEYSKGRSQAGILGCKFGGKLAVLTNSEVLVLVASLIDDKQLHLVGGVKREPRGCLVRHIGLCKKINFVLAIEGDRLR
jgi:hypothetical protein